jgi:hypothetical protein
MPCLPVPITLSTTSVVLQFSFFSFLTVVVILGWQYLTRK